MAVLEVDSAYFVIWATVDNKIIQVQFDDDYWNNVMLPSIKFFFDTHIVAELLTERIKRGLSLTDVQPNEVAAVMNADAGAHNVVCLEPVRVANGSNITNACNTTCSSSRCINDTAPYSVRDKFIACEVNLQCQKILFIILLVKDSLRTSD